MDGQQTPDIDPRLESYLVHGVERDWVDRRDRFFSAPLSILRGSIDPHGVAFPRPTGSVALVPPAFGLRDQGPTGRCVGYALANIIDIQRRIQSSPDRPLDPDTKVSADMLYAMARFHDRYEQREDGRLALASDVRRGAGVRTLRSVIKAFYHHGACPDHSDLDDCPPEAWPSVPTDPLVHELLTVEQAKAARRVNLGAYYRLRPILNDYHAALNEAHAVLVSANLTRNWFRPAADGRIGWFENLVADMGTHAFVLVGYNDEGFLALNSWGDRWGGYRDCPGIGLWSYRDWAQNIVDAWVLRLGVPAPDAFDLSIGEQGQSRIYGPVRSGSPPCHELLGHYLHLDDGRYVERSAYPSEACITQKTLSLLDERARNPDRPLPARSHRGVVLWIPGSLETLEQSFGLAVARKSWLQELGLYPLNVFWCNDFAEHAIEILGGVFRDCEKMAGPDAAHLDDLIEERAQGLGRAFWRDIEEAARRSVQGHSPGQVGPVLEVAECVFRQAMQHGRQLHIVAEGAGALLLDEMLRALVLRVEGGLKELAGATTSVALSLPAIRIGSTETGAGPSLAEDRLLPFLAAVNRGREVGVSDPVLLAGSPGPRRASKIEGVRRPPARVLLPDAALERRLHVSSYRHSILHLVARSFMGHFGSRQRPVPPVLLGMAEAEPLLRKGAGCNAVTEVRVPSDAPLARGPVDQLTLSLHPDLEAALLADIRDHARAAAEF